MHSKTKKLVITALMAALTCVATIVIRIPSPLKGYINVGDCLVLTAGWLLGPVYGFWGAAIGSCLADVLAGYLLYAPATFVIKGLMALFAFYSHSCASKKIKPTPAKLLSGIGAELLMIFLYFLFEGILYGFIPALMNIPANGVQGIVGILLALILSRFLKNRSLF